MVSETVLSTAGSNWRASLPREQFETDQSGNMCDSVSLADGQREQTDIPHQDSSSQLTHQELTQQPILQNI